MGSDSWSLVLALLSAENLAFPTGADMNTYAASALASFNTKYWTATGAGQAINGPFCKLAFAKAYGYNSGGALAAEGAATMTATGGTATSSHPAYVAMCATLITDSFGRSYRGRSFLPATGAYIGTDAQFSVGQATSNATAYGLFLKNLNTLTAPTASGDQFQPAVLSIAKAVLTPISQVAIDTIPDTQRGRQNKLTATGRAVEPAI
uniref:Uncharacterized protein n=1 Tax=uncultured prokaryote TaxID=198431 RepID=A0A0H5Q6N1_9ZZZZ|nr:hypothetical protein [uncultured prokaryote]